MSKRKRAEALIGKTIDVNGYDYIRIVEAVIIDVPNINSLSSDIEVESYRKYGKPELCLKLRSLDYTFWQLAKVNSRVRYKVM